MKKLLGILLLLSPCVHASELKKMLVMHPLFGLTQVTYEVQNNLALVESDIILSEKNVQSPQILATTVRLQTHIWRDGIIPYEFDVTLPEANKKAALEAMKLWHQKTQIQFVERTPDNEAMYPDYIFLTPNENNICASAVGMQGGRQTVQLSPRCSTMISVHELGHTLGLWHEQSRADRDNYVKIYWENIIERAKYNFNQHITDGVDHGPYDYGSIMHYSAYAFSKNGKKTMDPIEKDATIGQRDKISDLDAAAIYELYTRSH